MIKKIVMSTAVAALLGLCFVHAREQESNRRDPLLIPRLNGPITLNGLSDEQAWDSIPPLPVVEHSPNFGEAPSEKTEILAAFDHDYLYLAGRLFYSDPSKIQASTKKRDTMSPSSDFFGMIIDTFNDKENGLAFFTTPSGLRWDATIYNDAQLADPLQADPPMNLSWNTFWDVETVCNEQGWFVEMRIPLSSLRFQDRGGRVVMGLIVWRWIAGKNEVIVFPAIPPDWGPWSSWKPSQAQEVVLEGVTSRKPLYIAPYILGGYGESFDLNEEETSYKRLREPAREVGLDIKYGLTSNLTLDVTANTDFAQVEADNQQVNLTRFSLFFPEKRLFFQERSSIFDFRFGGPNRLFYSRRIGIYEEELVRIYGGMRLVGRLGQYDLGLMSMQTAPVEDLSSENFSVLRVRRRVFNPFSYVGGIVTSRIGWDGTYNTAYGLDGIVRLFGHDYLTFNWAQTFENDLENKVFSLDPARFRVNWERRTLKGIGYNLSYSRAGKDYSPGMGFEMREDFTRFGNRLHYAWMPGEKSFLYRHQVLLGGFVFLKNSDNTPESVELGPGWMFETKSGFGGMIQPKLYYEDITESFDIADEAEVPVGEYTFYGMTGNFITPMGRRFSLITTWDAGSFYDGWRVTVGFMPQWSLSSVLGLSGYYEFNRLEFPDRSQQLTAHIARLRVLATLSTTFTASAFIQYNGASDVIIANVRLRYNPREGNDLYIVYNEGINTDRYRDIPVLPYRDSRAIMLKYTYTFNVK